MGKCWHVTTASGEVYGADAMTAREARDRVAERLANEGSNDRPESARLAAPWDAPHGTVLHY